MNILKKLYTIQHKMKELAEEELKLIEEATSKNITATRGYKLIKCTIDQEIVDTKQFFTFLKHKKKSSTTFKGKDPLQIILQLAVISKRKAYTYLSDEEMKKVERIVSTNLYKVEKDK